MAQYWGSPEVERQEMLSSWLPSSSGLMVRSFSAPALMSALRPPALRGPSEVGVWTEDSEFDFTAEDESCFSSPSPPPVFHEPSYYYDDQLLMQALYVSVPAYSCHPPDAGYEQRTVAVARTGARPQRLPPLSAPPTNPDLRIASFDESIMMLEQSPKRRRVEADLCAPMPLELPQLTYADDGALGMPAGSKRERPSPRHVADFVGAHCAPRPREAIGFPRPAIRQVRQRRAGTGLAKRRPKVPRQVQKAGSTVATGEKTARVPDLKSEDCPPIPRGSWRMRTRLGRATCAAEEPSAPWVAAEEELSENGEDKAASYGLDSGLWIIVERGVACDQPGCDYHCPRRGVSMRRHFHATCEHLHRKGKREGTRFYTHQREKAYKHQRLHKQEANKARNAAAAAAAAAAGK